MEIEVIWYLGFCGAVSEVAGIAFSTKNSTLHSSHSTLFNPLSAIKNRPFPARLFYIKYIRKSRDLEHFVYDVVHVGHLHTPFGCINMLLRHQQGAQSGG